MATDTHNIVSNGATLTLETGAIYTYSGGLQYNQFVTGFYRGDGVVAEVQSGGTLFTNAAILSGNYASDKLEENIGGNGGAIFNSNGGMVYVSGGVLIDNQGARCGGALYNGGKAEISGAHIVGNQAYYGGAIFNAAFASCAISDTVFSGNSTSLSGGAIFNSVNGTLDIVGGRFVCNEADYNGGAICNHGTATVHNALFSGNTAVSCGGAIYNTGTATVHDALFSGNSDARYGGAIYNTGTANVLGTLFSDNSAFYRGGAIQNTGTLYVSGCTFVSNLVSSLTIGDAGALGNYGGTVEIVDVCFSGNSAMKYGGAIYNSTGVMNISGASFISNVTLNNQGGALNVSAGTVNISGDVLFSGNSAQTQGGAIYLNRSATLNLADVTFNGNSAVTNGGAIFIAAGTTKGGTVNLQGAVTLATVNDTIYINGACATLNWDITGGTAAYGALNGYQNLNNDNGGALNITVAATQEAGTYAIATGDLSTLTGKNTFTVKTADDATGASISVNGESITYSGMKYTLAVDDNGTASDATDDKLVLTVKELLTATVDEALVGKWFKADEEITVTGIYTGKDITTFTFGGNAVTYDTVAKTWSYTFASHEDTTGTDYAIAIATADDDGSATYTLKVDTVAPAIEYEATAGYNADGVRWYKKGTQAAITATAEDDTSKVASMVLDGTTYTAGTTYKLSTGYEQSTPWNVSIYAIDTAGNSSSSVFKYDVDGSAPTMGDITVSDSYVAGTDTYWVKQGASVTVGTTISDAKSGVKDDSVKFDGVLYKSGDAVVVATTEECALTEHTFSATDNVGNAAEKKIAIGVDGTGPTLTVTRTPDTGIGANDTITVTASATDDLSSLDKITYSIDGATAQDYTAALSITENCTIEFTAYDKVGNASTETVTIEEFAPQITVTTAAKWFKFGDTVTIAGTVKDGAHEGIQSFTVSVGGGEAVAVSLTGTSTEHVYSWSYTYTGEDTAGTTLAFAATDANSRTGTANYTLKVDTVAPAIEYAATAGYDADGVRWYKKGTQAAITATAEDGTSQVASMVLDGTTYTAGTTKVLSTGYEQSTPWTVSISAIDTAGNSRTSTFKYDVDGSGPAIGDITVSDSYVAGTDTYWVKQGASVTVGTTISDAKSGVKDVTLGGAEVTGTADAYSTAYNTVAERELTEYAVTATDNVGNAAEKKITIGVDGTGPEFTTPVVTGGNAYGVSASEFWVKQGETVTVKTTISDDLSCVNADTVELDGNAYVSGTEAAVATTDECGLTAHTFSAADNVENTNTTTVSIGVDGTGPEFTAIEVAGTHLYATEEGYWVKLNDTVTAKTGVSDAKSGVKDDTVTFDGNLYKSGDAAAISAASECELTGHTFSASDNVGNAAEDQKVKIGVDGTGPAFTKVEIASDNIFATDSGYWVRQGDATTAKTVISDGKSGVNDASVTFDNKAYAAGDAAAVDTTKECGMTTHTFSAADNVTNVNTTTVKIGVDGTEPTFTAIEVVGGNVYSTADGYWVKQGGSVTAKTTIDDAKSGVDAASVTLDGAAYASGTAAVVDTSVECGLTAHTFSAADNVGNTGTASAKIGVDGTGPVVGETAITGANVYENWIKTGTAFTVTVAVTDAKSGLKAATLEGADYADGKFELTAATSEMAMGAHTIAAVDNVGNASSLAVQYGFDGTGPLVGSHTFTGDSVYVDAEGAAWFRQNDVTAALEVAITDSKSGLKSATYGKTAYADGQFALDTSAEGYSENYITATDHVGNKRNTSWIGYNVDGTAAVIGELGITGTDIYETAEGTWVKAGADFTIGTTVTDAQSGVKDDTVILNGEVFARGENDLFSRTFNQSADSDMAAWQLSASDNVGNTTTGTINVGIDGTGPDIGDAAIVGANVYENWIKAGTAFAVATAIADAKSGLKAATLEGADYSDGQFALTAGEESDIAEHTIQAVDNLGNESAAAVKYGFDGTGPEIGDVAVSGSNVYENWIKTGTAFAVTADITDDRSGLGKTTLDGVDYAQGKFELIAGEDAEVSDHAILAADNVGNESTGTIRYGFDGEGPTIGEAAITGDCVYQNWIKSGTAFTVTAAIGDAKSGLDAASLEGADYVDGQFKLVAGEDTDMADHAITATDKVGNESAAAVVYGFDGEGPAIGEAAIIGGNVSGSWVKAGTAFAVAAEISDDKSGLKAATLEGADYADGQFALTAGEESDIAEHTLQAVDNLGNESAAVVKYGFDGTGPAIGEAAVSGSNVYENWIKTGTVFAVTAAITDDKSGVGKTTLEGADYADGKFELIAGADAEVSDHAILAADNVGNESTGAVSYGFDGAGPEIGEAAITGDSVYQNWIKSGTAFTVTAAIGDAKSGLKSAALEGAAYADGKFELLAGEEETACVAHAIKAVDNVGNESAAEITYGFDGTGPEIGEAAFTGDSLYIDGQSTVWFRQDDATAALEVGIADARSGLAAATYDGIGYVDGKFAIDTTAEGGVEAAVTATDNVGNESASAQIGYQVDGTGPVIGDASISGGYVSGSWIKAGTAFAVTVDIADDKSGLKTATLDGAKYADGRFVLAAGADSEQIDHTLRAVDNVGNESSVSISYGFDGTGPEVGETALVGDNVSGNWVKAGTAFAVTAAITDAKSGLAIATLEGADYADGQFELLAGADSDLAVHTISAADKVGNASTGSILYGIDGTGPEISRLGLSGNNVYGNWIKSGTAFTISAAITDAKSGLDTATLDGATYADGGFTLTAGADSAIAVHTLTASDKVGNESSVALYYGFDGTGPSITVTQTPATDYAATVEVTAVFADEGGSGVAQQLYSADGSTWYYYTGALTFTGNGTVYFGAIDNVGNTNIVTCTVTNVDAVAPSVTIDADTITVQEQVAFTVSATDATTAVSKLEYSIDGGTSWTDCSITPDKSVIATMTARVNNTTYIFRAYDQAGNASATASVTFNNIYKDVEESYEVRERKDVTSDQPVDAEVVLMAEDAVMNVEAGGTVDTEALVLNGGNAIRNSGSVKAGTLTVSGTGNAIAGDTVEVETIVLAANAELGVDKDQYDVFMANTEFEAGDGKLVVSYSTGNGLRADDIDTLMNKTNLTAVEFDQALQEVNKLNIKSTKATTIAFKDGYGTVKNDTIRFYKDTDVTFGAADGEINLEEGNNKVQIDKNATTRILSDLTHVSTIQAAAGSTVELADVEFQEGRNATLKAEAASFKAGCINGTDRATTITVGKNTAFESQDIAFADKNDKITANSGSSVAVGSTSGDVFTGETIEFNGGNDTLDAKGSRFIAGTISFGTGNDKLAIGNDTVFGAVAGYTGTLETATDDTYADIEFGDGNDKLTTGKNAVLCAAGLTGIETISLGAYSRTAVDDISGVKSLSTANGKDGQTTKLNADNVTGTAANDSVSFGKWSEADLASLDLGDGNDTLKLGDYADVNIDDLTFGDGAKDKLTIGKGATLTVESLDVDSLETLSMGKDARLVLADAGDLADAQAKWSKYSAQIIAKLA